jgi:hypothetical protein
MTLPTAQRVLTPRLDLSLVVREAGPARTRPVLVLHGAAGPGSVSAIVDHLATDHQATGV